MSPQLSSQWKSPRILSTHGTLQLLLAQQQTREHLVLYANADAHRIHSIAQAHQSVHAPMIASVHQQETSAQTAWVSFHCSASTTLETLAQHARRKQQLLPYAMAIALNELLFDTLEAAHLASNGPFCIGALSPHNILVDAQGNCWLFGLGDNFPSQAENALSSVQAPEVLLGAPATPRSDVYAVHAFARQLLPFVAPAPFLQAAVKTDANNEEPTRSALFALARALDADPHKRIASIAELRNAYRAVRATVPSLPPPDFDGLKSFLAQLFSQLSPSTPSNKLTLDAQTRAAHIDERSIELARFGAPWRILWRLGQARVEAPGSVVSMEELQNAGWPGEKILPDAARKRLYVAISTLRKHGLEPYLLHRDDGYLLSTTHDVQLLSETT